MTVTVEVWAHFVCVVIVLVAVAVPVNFAMMSVLEICPLATFNESSTLDLNYLLSLWCGGESVRGRLTSMFLGSLRGSITIDITQLLEATPSFLGSRILTCNPEAGNPRK